MDADFESGATVSTLMRKWGAVVGSNAAFACDGSDTFEKAIVFVDWYNFENNYHMRARGRGLFFTFGHFLAFFGQILGK